MPGRPSIPAALTPRSLRRLSRAATQLANMHGKRLANAQRSAATLLRSEVGRSATGRMANEIERLVVRGTLRGLPSLDSYLKNQIGRTALGHGVTEVVRYGLFGALSGWAMKQLGPLGQAIEFLVGGLKRPGTTNQAVADAKRLLEALGAEITLPDDVLASVPVGAAIGPSLFAPPAPVTPGTPRRAKPLPGQPGQPSPGQPAGPLPSSQPGRSADPSTGQPPEVPGREPPGESAGRREPRLPRGSFPGRQSMAMTFVLGSSNVYAYGYNPDTLTLRVEYLAHTVNASALTGKGHKGKNRVKGALGRTVTGDRSGPGPVYDYHGVPANVFRRFDNAASKGGAVWDLLRIRGTIEGHKYDYELVAAGLVDVVKPAFRNVGSGGVQLVGGERVGRITYVPRKAVGRGQFKSRTIGQGNRTFRSVLPSEGLGRDGRR